MTPFDETVLPAYWLSIGMILERVRIAPDSVKHTDLLEIPMYLIEPPLFGEDDEPWAFG
jgi:hypothetical protein